MRLILASSSKYRQAFAKEWGLSFTCIHPNINEDIISTDTHTNRSQCPPDQLCLAIAKAKASAVLEILKAQKEEEECLIVTSDQVSWFNQRIREKPRDLAQAREWMIEYQKSPIRVCTAIVVTHFPSERPEFGTKFASQMYKEIPADVLDEFLSTNEVLNNCGGFSVTNEKLKSYLGDREGTEDEIAGFPRQLLFSLLDRFQFQQNH